MMRFAATIFALLLGGCSALFTDAEAGDPVEFTRLSEHDHAYSFRSGMSEPLQLVVRDIDGWADAWVQIHMGRDPEPPLPTIDFREEMVLAVALGTRATGGYSIVVEGVYEHPRHLVAVVRTYSPAAGCMLPQMVTQPVDLARTARSEKPVHFRTLHSVLRCGG